MNSKFLPFAFLLISSFTFGQDLDFQMEAFFDFENNINDQSGNDNNLEVLQGTANFINYNGGQALSLDGNTQITTTNVFDVSHSDSFAISIVFRTSTVTNELQTILQGANIGFGVFIAESTGRLYTFLDRSSADPILSVEPVTDGEWHIAVVQSNGTETSLYLDGVFQGSRTEILDVGNGSSNNRMFIGASNLNTRQFTGEIDKLRVYSRDLMSCDRIGLVLNNFEPEGIFHFDGNLEDASTRGSNFEVTDGQISYENFAPDDDAIVFDGNTRIASINPYDNSDFKNTAISFWFRADEAKPEKQVLLQGANMGVIMYLEEGTGLVALAFDNTSSDALKSRTSMADGTWHHVTAMSVGTGTILIIDGIFEGFATEDLLVGDGGATNKWYLGQISANAWNFTGAINNLTIYDHVLEQCQIDRLIEMGPVSSTENLIEIEPNYSIMPNPSAGQFLIKFEENDLPDFLQVYDLNGNLIFSDHRIDNLNYQLNLNQQSGIYILKAISNNKYSIVKLIKH